MLSLITSWFQRMRYRQIHGRNPYIDSADHLIREQQLQAEREVLDKYEQRIRYCLSCEKEIGGCDDVHN